MKRVAWTRLLFASSLLWHQPLVLAIPSSSLENMKPLRASIEARLVGKVITLRQVPNYSTTLYFGNATNSYIVALRVSGLFPTKEEVANVTVSRVDNVVESEILARKIVSDVGKPIVTEDIRDYRHYWRLTLKHRS